MKKKNFNFTKGPRNLIIGVLLFVASLFMLVMLTDTTRTKKSLSYSSFLTFVEKGNVRNVTVDGQVVQGTLTDGSHFEVKTPEDPKMWDLLRQHNVEMNVAAAMPFLSWPFLLLIMMLGGLLAFWLFTRQMKQGSGGGGAGGGQNIFSIGKNKARMYMPSEIKVNFNSVAGAVEAKEELKDVVGFLKNPEKYRRLGAKITRGVLLVGEPGNGKTLLAKAVAGEANCPFFSISGSDFIEVFVGVGAARVRDLFAQARKNAPCIIFIDEIDAVGRHRGSGLGGGNDEREQTLNQMLAEMDGFATQGGDVIVLAATNRPDVLDKALLRPGRFDRQVEVPYPDLKCRQDILKLHAKGVKIDPEVNLDKIARGTPGFSGADLANLINEAAIIASKTDQKTVKIADFEEARDKITLGKESKTKVLSPEEREVTAYHEAGHALVLLSLPLDTEPLHKVTIIPRGQSLGVTHWLPERDKYQRTKEEILANIQVAMGGRAAEEIAFNKVTTGASSDFQNASGLARAMVCSYGMSDTLGPVVYQQSQTSYHYSQDTARKIDEEVRSILTSNYEKAKEILNAQRDKLDLLAKELLEKETLYAGEIYTLLGIEPRTEHTFN